MLIFLVSLMIIGMTYNIYLFSKYLKLLNQFVDTLRIHNRIHGLLKNRLDILSNRIDVNQEVLSGYLDGN